VQPVALPQRFGNSLPGGFATPLVRDHFGVISVLLCSENNWLVSFGPRRNTKSANSNLVTKSALPPFLSRLRVSL
jgi:hypothetical protein